MFLIGSDILRGGRSASEWNFSGLITETHAAGNVSGCLVFVRSGSEVRCPCVNVPTEGVQPFAYNPQATSIPVAAAAFVRSGMIGMVSRPLPQFNLVAGPPLKVPDRIFRVSG